MKNITDGVISFTFNVQTINDDDKYYGMSANATLTGNDVGSGVPTESKATTIITGEVTYTTSKSFTTVPGTGNRVVTYSFNISSSGSKGQFSSWKQVITDSLPAGTQIIGNEGKSGKWDIVGDESTGWQAEWISNKLHKPGTDLGNEKDFPTLTVYYPEDKFSNGTRPPKNTSNLKVYDKNNQEYDGGQGSTQGPAMSEGTPEGVGVDKRSGTNQGGGSWYDGYYNRHFQIDGSFVSASGKTARELTVEDDRDQYNNQEFWDRLNVYQVDVNFNANMVSAAADYRLEYKTNQHSWEEAYSGNTTKSGDAITFNHADSIGYSKGNKRVSLTEGERVTGIRVLVGNKNDDSIKIPSTSVVTLDFYVFPSYNNRETGSGGGDEKLWNNHVIANGYNETGIAYKEASDDYALHIKNNLMLGTAVTAPETMNVGEDATYTAYINNQSASFDYKNAVMKVVLPTGIYYDQGKGVSAKADVSDSPYELPIPKPGSGVTISTEMIGPTPNDPQQHQVVTFKFNEDIPAMRMAGSATDRMIERKGLGYNIPVQVTSDAYANNRSGAAVSSWATTEDPNLKDLTVHNYDVLIHQDDYNFDPNRDKIAWAKGQSQIQTKGGLLLTKLVSNERDSSFTADQPAFAKDKMHWQLKLQNILPSTVTDAQVFDRLPQKGDNNDFSTELSGPITGLPSGSIVEYSKDATSATTGSWTDDWQGANAFRITIPSILMNQSITVDVPFLIPDGVKVQDEIENKATGTGNYNGNNVSYDSNISSVFITNGSVELTKTDNETNANLQGAVFDLQNDSGERLQQGLTTDQNGKIKVDELAPGNYQFVETKAPADYKLDPTPVKFTIQKEQTSAVQVGMQNKLIPGSVLLTKTDAETGKVLQGAKFELQDETGKTLDQDLTTDSSGKLAINDLTPGNYQFVETKAPVGYKLDPTPVKFTIQKGQTSAVQVNMQNKAIPGSVLLTKTDAETGKVLQGAKFELQDETGKTLDQDLTTDSSGKLAINDLTPGNYQFVETKAPVGYKLDPTPAKFTIQKGQTSAVQVNIQNKAIPGSVLLTKTDDKTGKALQGAEFELQDETGKHLKQGLTTDSSGKLAVTGLTPGNYQFVETKAPTDYELDPTPVKFTIQKGQIGAVQVNMQNKLTPGSVLLTKTDAETGKVLQGAKFKLQDQSGKTLYQELTTDSSGQLTVNDLAPGNYQFVETTAPVGYKLDSTPVRFVIEKSQRKVVKVSITNKRNHVSNDPDNHSQTPNILPKTGDGGFGVTLSMLGVLILLTLYFSIYKYKKKE
ncbi:MSCRAMM family protein [Listeria aquatica]|uniref:MSCRAMM family protein n=1 Tax=Listeria aquatica TaxID=1494960 RepID=UPI003F727C96